MAGKNAEEGEEAVPGIENVCFSFSMGEPFAQDCKSEPLSVALPVAEEEGGEVPPMPNWAEELSPFVLDPKIQKIPQQGSPHRVPRQ